jgi:hypothetical protein
MKIKQIIALAVVALSGAAAAKAQNFANPGDLILGFRNGTSGQVLEVDLGPATSFTTTAHFNLTNGSYTGPSANSNAGWLPTDMDIVFGSSFGSLSLDFGAAAYSGSGATGIVWATQSGTVASTTGVTNAINKISTETGGWASGDNTASGTFGVTSGDDGAFDANTTQAANYVGAVRPSGAANDYGFFNGHSTEAIMPSTGSINLPLYKLPNNGTAIEEGIFTLTSNGDSSTLTYNGVPEPTTLGLLGFTAVGMLGLRRRRVAA